MTIDLDYKNAEIIAKYPVEESLNTLVHCLDARHKDSSFNTYDVRNSKCAEIHSCIMMIAQFDQIINDTKNMVDDIKLDRSTDKEGIYGYEDKRAKQSDVLELEQSKDWYVNQALGLISLLWVNFGVTHTSCLLYTSAGWKKSKKQMKIMKQSMTGDYYKYIAMAEEEMPTLLQGLTQTFKDERQLYGYTVNNNLQKFDQMTKPPVKQADMFEKQAVSGLIQVEDKQKKLDAILDKQPVVIKEAVNR